MATSGTTTFSLGDGAAKVEGTISWRTSGNRAYVKLTKVIGYAYAFYSSSYGTYVYQGNSAEYVKVAIDGTASATVLAVTAHTSWTHAAASGWIADKSGLSTAEVSAAIKTGAYSIVVTVTGNGGNSVTKSISMTFPFTVTFDPNGGSVSTTSKTVNYGSTYGTLPTPTLSRYNFLGWYTAATGGTRVTSGTTVTITANQTLYAHWERATIPIYVNDGGTVRDCEAVYINDGGTLRSSMDVFVNDNGTIKQL